MFYRRLSHGKFSLLHLDFGKGGRLLRFQRAGLHPHELVALLYQSPSLTKFLNPAGQFGRNIDLSRLSLPLPL